MIPILVDGPQLEPVTLNEAKTWLKVDGADDDDLIRTLIVAARLMVEAEIGQVLMAQNWRLVGDHWPSCDLISVRIGHILGVSGARVYAADGTITVIDLTSVAVVHAAAPNAINPMQRPQPGRARAGIEIDLRLGFGEAASDVPDTIRLAIRRLVALWFEDRGDVGQVEAGLPPAIRALLRPFRRIRL